MTCSCHVKPLFIQRFSSQDLCNRGHISLCAMSETWMSPSWKFLKGHDFLCPQEGLNCVPVTCNTVT